MDRCPLCGSPLECREDALAVWCCSPECGACFRDLNLAGAARRLAWEGGAEGAGAVRGEKPGGAEPATPSGAGSD